MHLKTLLIALFSLLSLCSSSARAADNLLLISIDTLRADHLSCYGYQANQTPGLDRWAREGVRFEKTYSEVPLTLPSHSTLLTGDYPFRHGVRNNGGFALAVDKTTLAEVLQKQGYRTAAFVSAYVLASRFGLAQGFDLYDEVDSFEQGAALSVESVRRPAEQVGGRLLKWLEERSSDSGRPFFAWAHFFDPHAPWPTSYDGEISRVDGQIVAIDAALRRLKLLDKTHIIVVGDHGESLGDHGETGHGFFVYDSTLQVPFILRPAVSFSPQVPVIADAVSLVDVMPTALRLLKITVPGTVQGQSLLGQMLGRSPDPRPLYAETLMPRLNFGWAHLSSLRQGHLKLIQAPRPELYDLVADPGETRNIYSQNRAAAARLEQDLAELKTKFGGETAGSGEMSGFDSAGAEKLATLGYAALARPVLKEQNEGADPKEKLAIYELYTEVLAQLSTVALRSLKSGGETLFQKTTRLRRLDPELRGLHHLDGLAYERLGDLQAARRSYLLELEENPSNHIARANLGNIYVALGELEAAESAYRAVVFQAPEDVQTRAHLAMLVYRRRGDSQAALSEFRRLVEQAPDHPAVWLDLGIVAAESELFPEAERAFRRVIELDPAHPRAYTYLARILQAQGRNEDAEAVLRRSRKPRP